MVPALDPVRIIEPPWPISGNAFWTVKIEPFTLVSKISDYALTPLGRSLAVAIVPLCTWGTENMAEMASIFAERDSFPLAGC